VRTGVVQREEEKDWGDLTAAFLHMKGGCCDRTRGNGFKVTEGIFRLGTRKKLFTMRLVRCWHRLPREAVAAPSLEVFKARLDAALSNLV